MSRLLLVALLIGLGIALVLVVALWPRRRVKRPAEADTSAMTELISDELTEEMLPPSLQARAGPSPVERFLPASKEAEFAGYKVIEYDPLEEEAFSKARLLEEGELPPRAEERPPEREAPPVEVPEFPLGPTARGVLARPSAMVAAHSLQDPPILDAWRPSEGVAGDQAEVSSEPGPHLPEDFHRLLDEAVLSVEEEERRGAAIPYETLYALGLLAYYGAKFELAVAQAQMALQTHGERARALNLMALAYYHQGFETEAEGRLREAAALPAEDPEGQAAVFTNLALLSTYKRSAEEALHFYAQALEVHRKREDLLGAGEILSRIGRLCRAKGSLEEATQYHREALEIYRGGGNRGKEARELRLLAAVLRDQGEVKESLEFSQRALSLNRELKDRREEAINLGNIGLLLALKKNFPRSRQFYEEALGLHREVGNRRGEANSLGNLGNILFQTGESERALEAYRKAYEINREIGYRWGQAANLASIGKIYAERGGLERALEHLREALRLFGELNAQSQCTALEAAIEQLERQRLEASSGGSRS